jgi:hypothetical protein
MQKRKNTEKIYKLTIRVPATLHKQIGEILLETEGTFQRFVLQKFREEVSLHEMMGNTQEAIQ